MVTVYVIESVNSSYRYVGITNNLKDRIKQHNLGQSLSTKPYAPYKIIYTEKYADYTTARKREGFLKSGVGRKFLDTMK